MKTSVSNNVNALWLLSVLPMASIRGPGSQLMTKTVKEKID